jgi:hypothetical protein
MKLAFIKSINLRLLIAMLAAGLMFTTFGCGDDDEEENDNGGSDASVANGGKGGGGGTSGKAGKGGGGSGGTATINGPKTAAECEAIVQKAAGEVSSSTKCLCDKCLDSFGPCVADSACFAVIGCGTMNQCNGPNSQTCYMEKCMTEIGKLEGNTAGLLAVGTCAATKCMEAVDSGI